VKNLGTLASKAKAPPPVLSAGEPVPNSSLILPPRPNRAVVRRFKYLHFRVSIIEALPPQSKQFAGTQGIRHVEFQQNTIPQREVEQCVSQLLPGQSGSVRVPQL
jgi:hypothetical protein